MKINHFVVIPANVRYDKFLTDKAKLLWGEISAASNTYGVCEEDTSYLANLINVDKRTVLRCLSNLIDNGHVIRLYEKNKRKLKVVFQSLPIPENTEVIVDKQVDAGGEIEFASRILSIWEERLKYSVQEKESIIPVIRKRLQDFSQEEILKAVDNRITMLRESPWHTENKETTYHPLHVFDNSDNVLKWLQYK